MVAGGLFRAAGAPAAAGLLLLLLCVPAQAEPDHERLAPVFEGHPDLVTRTKEAAFEVSLARHENGDLVPAAGFAVAAFYTRWLSLLGAAHFTATLDRRQHYDTRALARFIYPEPIAGIFFYGAAGLTVFFRESEARDSAYSRNFGVVASAGGFVNLGESFRLRLTARDHWLLLPDEGRGHSRFVTLSFVVLYR